MKSISQPENHYTHRLGHMKRILVVILKKLSEDEANTYRLVLSSTGISCHLKRGEHGWDISVNDMDYENAINAIEKYFEENQDFQSTDDSFYDEYQRTYTGIWVSIILLACHVAFAMSDKSEFFIRTYGSSAFHILHGELYRSATSLMLHANALHIMGNIAGIIIFGTAVCLIMGWGVGWFMILMTGITGNLVNALLFQPDRISVGASTAIFGALGILSAYQFIRKFRQPGQKIKAFLPLSCGLALLGILGSGENSDLMAHLFGFSGGIILGSFYSILVKRPISKEYQAYTLFLTLGILALAWMKAF